MLKNVILIGGFQTVTNTFFPIHFHALQFIHATRAIKTEMNVKKFASARCICERSIGEFRCIQNLEKRTTLDPQDSSFFFSKVYLSAIPSLGGNRASLMRNRNSSGGASKLRV